MAFDITKLTPYAVGASVGIQALTGIGQMIAGAVMRRRAGEQPKYRIPTAVTEGVGIQRSLAAGGLPGYERISNQLEASTSRGLYAMEQSAPSAAALMAGAAALYSGQQRQRSALALQQEQFRAEQQARLSSLLTNVLAQYQHKQWELNKYQPWLTKMTAARALAGAGMQNIVNAFRGASNTLLTLGANNSDLNKLANMLGLNMGNMGQTNENGNMGQVPTMKKGTASIATKKSSGNRDIDLYEEARRAAQFPLKY